MENILPLITLIIICNDWQTWQGITGTSLDSGCLYIDHDHKIDPPKYPITKSVNFVGFLIFCGSLAGLSRQAQPLINGTLLEGPCNCTTVSSTINLPRVWLCVVIRWYMQVVLYPYYMWLVPQYVITRLAVKCTGEVMLSSPLCFSHYT